MKSLTGVIEGAEQQCLWFRTSDEIVRVTKSVNDSGRIDHGENAVGVTAQEH